MAHVTPPDNGARPAVRDPLPGLEDQLGLEFGERISKGRLHEVAEQALHLYDEAGSESRVRVRLEECTEAQGGARRNPLGILAAGCTGAGIGTMGRSDDRVGVRLKISALWITMLLLFAYGDIFGFFAPGHLEEIQRGEISGIEITQTFLFAVSVYVAIASLMVFLTLVLSPAAGRWVNLVLAILYVVSIVASAIGEDPYFLFLSAVEIGVLLAIAWYAWTWPRAREANE